MPAQKVSLQEKTSRIQADLFKRTMLLSYRLSFFFAWTTEVTHSVFIFAVNNQAWHLLYADDINLLS